jgi:hypothetical protein
MSLVELKAVQSGVRVNFEYISGITQIQLTITDQAEVGHITGDIPLNTSSNHGAMTKTIYVDVTSTSTFAILESGVSPDYFDFVEGVTYNVVAKFGMSSQTSTYTHDLPPVSADYSTVISHGNELLNIALTAANNNSANITSYFITIMGYDKTMAPATFQKSYDVDGNGNINESINGTESDFGLGGFDGQFQNDKLLEIVIAAKNAAGYEFESVTYHASPTSTANEPTLVINSGINAIDNNNLVSDEDLFVQIVPGVQIANAPDLFYLMAVNNQDGIKLYKKFEPSDLMVTDGELLSTGSSGWTVQNTGIPVNGEVATPLAFVDGTEYTFDCWASNANGQSPHISSDNTGTPSGLPAEPTATITVGSLNGVGSETIRVTIPVNPNSGNTLNNGSSITDYKITVGGNLTTVSLDNFDNSNTDAPFTDITGLTNGTDYGVSIVAVNANGDSTSFTASNAKPRTDPVAPTFVGGNNNEAGAAIPVQGAASTLNSGEVGGYVVALDGTGENGGDEVISYVFEVSIDSEFGVVVSSNNNAGVTENTFDSLIDGTLYYMRVKSVNSFGEESSYTVLGGDPLQPSTAPTIDETGLNALLMAGVKNTLVVANSNYFTVNIANVVNSVNTGGYDMSEIVVTMSGNDSQSITVDLANINNDVVFNGVNQLNLPATNELGANNSGYQYTLSVSANNAVYTENNTSSSSTSTIHVTNTLLTASNISATLNSSNSITFTWDVPDYDSLNQFTNGDGSNFNLQLQEKVPTEDGGTNEVSYPASFSNVGSLVNVNIVSGTTSYSQAFADLRYGTIYSVAITTNSEQYDVNSSVSHATGPVNDATGLVPHTKPTVEVVDGVGDAKTVTIKSNGLVLDTSISLDSGSSDPVKDLSTELTASTTAAVRGAGNSFVTGGNPAFTLYKDANGDMAELVSSISYTPTGGDNYLLITENSGTYGGATVLLNGNPLGLSQA